jgi:cytidylate kinase
MQQKIIIAIDGLSSSGKSTMAKRIARSLSYRYIDSGAFYRAVTLYFHEHAINWKDNDSIKKALLEIDVSFSFDLTSNESKTILNGRSVDHHIRGILISNLVSEVSAIPEVRKFVVRMLQQYADGKAL